MRLNKYLAECGICSRREADKIIEAMEITVNGEIASLGTKVESQDIVCYKGKKVLPKTDKVVLAYYKPVGVTCTEKDKNAERTIIEALNYKTRVTYAGRLDKDSEGLMIMTDDGDLIEGMMRGARGHEKEYKVWVDKVITSQFIEQMKKGVYLKELEQMTRPCKVTRIDDKCFQIILTQGLNRQIRRMCETLGYQVQALKRERVLNITLDKLTIGSYREITGKEKQELYDIVFRKVGKKC